MTQVIFSRNHSIGSLLLRTYMWSPWSHCGIVDEDRVYESIMFKGVVETSLEEFKRRSSKYAVVEFPANSVKSIEFAKSRVGKIKYDLRNIVGQIFHKKFEDSKASVCSEETDESLKYGGLTLFRLPSWRVTPAHLWMLNFPIIEEG